MPRALLLAALLALAPATAPADEPSCVLAFVADVETDAVRLHDGRLFLPDDPKDAADLRPNDAVLACDGHLQEIESLFPVLGRWLPDGT
jgi:hypothetical protein